MGVEGTCRSANRGGCPSCWWLSIANEAPICSRLLPAPESCLPCSIVANFQTIGAKQGKNKFFFGVLWCFLGILGDRKGQNLNIFLKVMEGKRLELWSAGCLSSCPLVQRWAGSLMLRICLNAGSAPLVVRSLLLVALLLCLRCDALEYAFICDFKGYFGGFYMFGVGLY